MKSAAWMFRRLRAMSAAEVLSHVRKRLQQRRDFAAAFPWSGPGMEPRPLFPHLPDPKSAPPDVKESIRADAERIMTGRWRAFQHLELVVDDPPSWHTDYLAKKSFPTQELAFGLNHRALPGGDIKLIWELSRWLQIVRLAEGAWLDSDRAAGLQCVRWLEDWVQHNAPFRGWNWTSALETGFRLIQFTWLDALLGAGALQSGTELAKLRAAILPAHVHYTWHYRSVGSSANNHLLGELTGLILALVRWPALAEWAVDLERLRTLWEREVLAQFAPDGGNREQALNYHLFSWELCWQAREALEAAGLSVSSAVHARLAAARLFFLAVQSEEEPWDYGDSDNAYVTPVAGREAQTVQEWWRWLARPEDSPSIDFWWKHSRHRPGNDSGTAANHYFPDSGILVQREKGGWFWRWDLSPLGYGTTAAHGHLDALHLSLWYRGMAVVIDPGTGAYYGDLELRHYLASRSAHNGPAAGSDFPRRFGPFLWGNHHDQPALHQDKEGWHAAEVRWGRSRIYRKVRALPQGQGLEIEDLCDHPHGFSVRWQFAPGTVLEHSETAAFRVKRQGISIRISVKVQVGSGEVEVVTSPKATSGKHGTVSPGFRSTCWAPYLEARVKGGENPCVLRTAFLV